MPSWLGDARRNDDFLYLGFDALLDVEPGVPGRHEWAWNAPSLLYNSIKCRLWLFI